MNVLVACVAENEAQWCDQVENLALSIRRFGGRLADAQIVACFVDAVDAEFTIRLARLDVRVKVVERSDFGVPATNKLRMFELLDPCDVFLAVDCDVVITGDPTPWFSTTNIRATPEHADHLTVDQWRTVFEAFQIPEPPQRLRMVSSGQSTYAYCSSGVLMVPGELRSPLHRYWKRFCAVYDELCDQEPALDRWRMFTDQVAMSCAIPALGLQVEPIPVSLNLCTTIPIHPAFRSQIGTPFVLHYRKEIDDSGFLYAAPYRVLNPFIDSVNRERAEFRGLSYKRLTHPPTARRLYRWVSQQSWYQSTLARKIRSSALAGKPREWVKAMVRGS